MEISVKNEKNEDYLNLFHKGDVILYKDHYCLITDIDRDDNAFLLRINSFDGFELYQNHWIDLPDNPEEKYIVGVNLFPASQYHLLIVKNDN